jgi:hypothetical protein
LWIKVYSSFYTLIIEKNKSIYAVEENDKQQQILNKFLESIIELNEEFLINILLKDFESTPIFNNLDVQNFTKILISLKNKNISKIR